MMILPLLGGIFIKRKRILLFEPKGKIKDMLILPGGRPKYPWSEKTALSRTIKKKLFGSVERKSDGLDIKIGCFYDEFEGELLNGQSVYIKTYFGTINRLNLTEKKYRDLDFKIYWMGINDVFDSPVSDLTLKVVNSLYKERYLG